MGPVDGISVDPDWKMHRREIHGQSAASRGVRKSFRLCMAGILSRNRDLRGIEVRLEMTALPGLTALPEITIPLGLSVPPEMTILHLVDVTAIPLVARNGGTGFFKQCLGC